MTKKSVLIGATLSAASFCIGITLAQEPVRNIDHNKHPNLAEAQLLCSQANTYIIAAQKDNRYDMHGHAQKARDLLVQVNQELKISAQDADSVDASQKKK
jgi:hypothetical protein